MTDPNSLNDWLRLVDQHRFHNPLTKTCYLCKVEIYRQDNTPTVRWSKAISRAIRPPLPVAVLLAVVAIQIIAIALLI